MTPSEDERLYEAFDDCCERVMAGESVAVCLERYPEHASELTFLLAAFVEIRNLRAVPPRAAEVAASSRASFMAAAENVAAVRSRTRIRAWAAFALWWEGIQAGLGNMLRGGFRPMPAGLALTIVLIIFAGLLTTGAIVASANALPGDRLYPVKTAAEQARILLTLDTHARAALIQGMAQERLREAQAIVELQRPVPSLRITGMIEEATPTRWTVSGLPIMITPETQISGIPEVGASATISLTAPGDGTLVAAYIVVEPLKADLRGIQFVSPIEPTLTPTAARPSPLPSPTASVTPTLTPMPVASEVGHALEPLIVPTDPIIRYNTATPAPSVTPTRTPTRLATPTQAASPTVTAWPTPPREQVKGRVMGWVRHIENDRWTIDDGTPAGVIVDTDQNTWYFGHPNVGYRVEANVIIRPDALPLALQIWVLQSPEAPPEPVEFTGIITALSDDEWTISGHNVKIRGDTQIIGEPHVGDVVEFKGVRQPGGEIWASHIRVLVLDEVALEGIIERMESDILVVDGRVVHIDSETQIIGNAVAGRYVQVLAVQMPDGTLIARVIYVVPDTPTPEPATPTPTVEITATLTPTETQVLLTPTVENTAVPTPTETQVLPTPTDTPAPTLAPTLTQTATNVAPAETVTVTPSPETVS
jgi:hypothetical protein